MNERIVKALRRNRPCARNVRKAEAGAMAEHYINLGIYDQGDVVVMPTTKQCFLDCTWDLAFIKKLNGIPYDGPMGMKYYPRSSVDCIILNLDDVRTWELAYAHGWLEDIRTTIDFREPDRTALRWALHNIRIHNTEVFDFLFEKYPETKLDDMCWQAGTAAAARWLCQDPHKADPYYTGLRYDMKSSTAAFPKPETDEILAIFYGDTDTV